MSASFPPFRTAFPPSEDQRGNSGVTEGGLGEEGGGVDGGGEGEGLGWWVTYMGV